MVDRLDGAESHGNSWELPEVWHEPRVRIRRQAAAGLQFAAKILQLLRRDAAFEIGASVHPRRRMALEINDIAVAGLGPGAQEMIECYFI